MVSKVPKLEKQENSDTEDAPPELIPMASASGDMEEEGDKVHEPKNTADSDGDEEAPVLLPKERKPAKTLMEALNNTSEASRSMKRSSEDYTNQLLSPLSLSAASPMLNKRKTRATAKVVSSASKSVSNQNPTTSQTRPTFMSVIGKRYTLAAKKSDDGIVPIKRFKVGTIPVTGNVSTVQDMLQNQKPTRIVVGVGSGTGTTSSNNTSPTEYQTSPSSTTQDSSPLHEQVKFSLEERNFPSNVIRETSTNGLLMGMMVINSLDILKKRGTSDYADMCLDLTQLMKKYNIS